MSGDAAPVSLADYEALARERLDPRTWAYFAGGAADEITLRANREAWASHWLQPRVLRAPAQGPLWFQLYLQGERGFDLELVRRAEAAGYEALVLTVDAPVHGARDRERRAGFRLPREVAAVNLAGAPPLPRGGELCAGLLQAAPGWDDAAWLRAHTRLPLVLKGVLHPDDARLAREHGADALPLLVGRPIVFALAVAGPQGVAHALRLLRDELEIAMALSGVATLDAAPRELLFEAPKTLLGAPWERPG